MVEPIFDPPLSAKSQDPFLQTIRLMDGDKEIARSRWISEQEATEGLVQIVELRVTPAYRRQGHGKRLMEVLVQQCREHFKLRKTRLRRIWLALDQKRNVIARSFLMRYTFNHVATVRELLKDEDLLIYMRAFD